MGLLYSLTLLIICLVCALMDTYFWNMYRNAKPVQILLIIGWGVVVLQLYFLIKVLVS